MFQRSEGQLILSGDFFLPFGGKLSEDNRWVLLAAMIPWAKVEEKYAESFKRSQKGQKAVPVRVALGALIIQERLGTDDRETLQQILENPYLQYFLGLPGYQNRRPFHASLMTHFRKRLGSDVIQEVNEWIALEEVKKQTDEQSPDDDDGDGGKTARSANGNHTHQTAEPPLHQGKLLLDATCAPPTWLTLPTCRCLMTREKSWKSSSTCFTSLNGEIWQNRVLTGKTQEKRTLPCPSSGA